MQTDFDLSDLTCPLDSLALDWLSDVERMSLMQPKTDVEILLASKPFPNGKAPGPIGLPMEFYKGSWHDDSPGCHI